MRALTASRRHDNGDIGGSKGGNTIQGDFCVAFAVKVVMVAASGCLRRETIEDA
jgi:hypothetical protein